MNALIDWLSNIYIGHPLFQAIVFYIGHALQVGFLLLMLWGCLFLGFVAKHRRYSIPPHSLSDKCWKATWLLQAVVLLVLAHGVYKDKYHMATGEIIFSFSPYVLMIASFILAGRYYQTTGKSLQEAERDNHGKRNIGIGRASDNRRI